MEKIFIYDLREMSIPSHILESGDTVKNDGGVIYSRRQLKNHRVAATVTRDEMDAWFEGRAADGAANAEIEAGLCGGRD